MDEDPQLLGITVLTFPAEDIPGVWVACCVPFNVVSQGKSEREAIQSLYEAIALTALWNHDHEGGPLPGPAPADQIADWRRLHAEAHRE